MFKWVCLIFFNMLWVGLPLFAMHVAFVDMKNAFVMRKGMVAIRMELQRREAQKEGKKEK
jgi:hypothetical protein